MFRLMKSEKPLYDDGNSGFMSSCQQIEVNCYLRLSTALEACDDANIAGTSLYYVLNESGQEYFNETWID